VRREHDNTYSLGIDMGAQGSKDVLVDQSRRMIAYKEIYRKAFSRGK
jgi:sugar (pentulose or hexulose) kinase